MRETIMNVSRTESSRGGLPPVTPPNEPPDRWGDDSECGEVPRGPTVAPPDATTFGLKLFLASLLMLFGAALIGYLVTRLRADKWTDFQVEGLRTGLVVSSVLILLVSASFSFALRGIRYDHRDRLKLGLGLAAIFATLFLVNQFDLWRDLWTRLAEQRSNVAVGSPEGGDLSIFLFFAMTILHALHVLGGFIPLGIVLHHAFRDIYSGANFRGVYNCAWYWHFIDIVWFLMAIALAIG